MSAATTHAAAPTTNAIVNPLALDDLHLVGALDSRRPPDGERVIAGTGSVSPLRAIARVAATAQKESRS